MGISSGLGSSALLPAGLGFRNVIINGDFRIDQRNAGASFTPTNTVYGLDRWVYGATQASKTTTQRITSTIPGFAHSMKVTSSSAYTPVSNDEIEWFQRIEAGQIAQFGWGTTSAKTAVLSFWVKSSITGTFGGSINDGSLSYSFPFSYTINTANAPEYKSITITPPPGGTWTSTGVGIGMHLFFSLGAAGTSLGTAGAWISGFKNGATGQTNLVATNGATLEITGVQLEQNLQPTPFEQRPIGVELALCQRYYSGVDYGTSNFVDGYQINTGYITLWIKLPQTMRVTPTSVSVSIGGTQNTTGHAAYAISPDTIQIYGNQVTTGRGYYYVSAVVASAELT